MAMNLENLDTFIDRSTRATNEYLMHGACYSVYICKLRDIPCPWRHLQCARLSSRSSHTVRCKNSDKWSPTSQIKVSVGSLSDLTAEGVSWSIAGRVHKDPNLGKLGIWTGRFTSHSSLLEILDTSHI